MFKFSHIISSSSMQLRALVMQIFQKRSPFLYLTDGSSLSEQKSSALSSFHVFLATYLKRIQPISLISLQLKVFRNLCTQLFHPSPRGSTDHSWPNLTSNPPQHRTISHGITDSPNRGNNTSPAFFFNFPAVWALTCLLNPLADWLSKGILGLGIENEPDALS